jgi:DNA polymerase III alpha subunit (gram-positive type)
MARILIFDTECNSLDVQHGYIQELAWGIYDTDNWRLLSSQSSLLDWSGKHYEVETEAFQVTGLSKVYCDRHGEMAREVFLQFIDDVLTADYIGGHNVVMYDKPMIESNVKRCLLSEMDWGMLRFFLDSATDIEYPQHQKIQKLKYLAYDHGFILSNAHQAMADVEACAYLFSKYNFDRITSIAKTPMVTLTAKIDFADTEGRAKVKNARFYWNPTKKHWEKRIRSFFVPGLQLELGEVLREDEISRNPENSK